MQYLLYFLLIGAIFGLIALGDFLLKKILPKSRYDTAQAVRLPRYSFILGLIVAMVGFIAILYVPRETEAFLWYGGWIVLVMGIGMLVNFFATGIFYDEEGFTYRVLFKKPRTYRYSDITAQRTFVAKSGWNTSLYAKDEEIQLYAAMQGVSEFLNKAFFAWCRQKGIDPDTVENNPHMLVFFPEPK